MLFPDGCICDIPFHVNPDCEFCNDVIEMAQKADLQMKLNLEERRKQREEAKAKAKATKERHRRIEAKVKELLPNAFDKYGSVVAKHRDAGFTIEFRDYETSFDDLQKLADAFGTKTINFGSEKREEGFCDTCHYSYTVNFVRVDDISEDWRPEDWRQ